jgi:hypothetical protein
MILVRRKVFTLTANLNTINSLSCFKAGQSKAKQALQELVILPALNPQVN